MQPLLLCLLPRQHLPILLGSMLTALWYVTSPAAPRLSSRTPADTQNMAFLRTTGTGTPRAADSSTAVRLASWRLAPPTADVHAPSASANCISSAACAGVTLKSIGSESPMLRDSSTSPAVGSQRSLRGAFRCRNRSEYTWKHELQGAASTQDRIDQIDYAAEQL